MGGGVASSQAGAETTGGNGTAQTKTITGSNPEEVFTTNGSWNIPTLLVNEVSRTIAIEISGGGGGPGNANANSGCTGQWPGWPTALSGRSGALGGYGGRGARLSGILEAQSGTLSWELGQGGRVGFKRRSGTSGQGTTGNDPVSYTHLTLPTKA